MCKYIYIFILSISTLAQDLTALSLFEVPSILHSICPKDDWLAFCAGYPRIMEVSGSSMARWSWTIEMEGSLPLGESTGVARTTSSTLSIAKPAGDRWWLLVLAFELWVPIDLYSDYIFIAFVDGHRLGWSKLVYAKFSSRPMNHPFNSIADSYAGFELILVYERC